MGAGLIIWLLFDSRTSAARLGNVCCKLEWKGQAADAGAGPHGLMARVPHPKCNGMEDGNQKPG
jgi:hypothetical protein